MRKFQALSLVFAISLTLVISSFGDPALVGITATKIVPQPGKRSAAAWATNTTYSQGEYVESEGLVYMVLVVSGGVSTNAPSGTGYAADGYYYYRTLSGKRNGLIIANPSTFQRFWFLDSSAVNTSNSLPLIANGGAVSFLGPECPQGEFFAITTNAATWAAVFEW